MNLGKDTILKPNYRIPTAQYFHDLSTYLNKHSYTTNRLSIRKHLSSNTFRLEKHKIIHAFDNKIHLHSGKHAFTLYIVNQYIYSIYNRYQPNL